MVSPYLERPLRTLEQAREDRARTASKRAALNPGPAAAGPDRGPAAGPARHAGPMLRLLTNKPMISLPAPGPPPCRAQAAADAAPGRSGGRNAA